MKKILFLSLFFINVFTENLDNFLGFLEEKEVKSYQDAKSKNLFNDFIIYFKPACFYPQDSRFRKIYKPGFMSLFEIDYFIYKKCSIWGNGGYFSKKKYIRKLDVRNRIYVIPFGMGLRYGKSLYCKCGINFFHVKNRRKVFSKNSQNSPGATFGMGWIFDIQRGWIGNIFFDYFYNKKKIYEKDSENIFFKYVGGFVLGGGVGYRF